MLLSEDIVNLRKKYSLSQVMLSKIMDFGEATISRYESNPYKTNHMIICCVAITELVYAHHDMGVFVFCVASDNCEDYTIGESKIKYLLFPKNLDTNYAYIISESSISKSPAD